MCLLPKPSGNLIVPVKLKYPVLTLVDYPEASLVGVPFNVTLSVELPPLLVNYKVRSLSGVTLTCRCCFCRFNALLLFFVKFYFCSRHL